MVHIVGLGASLFGFWLLMSGHFGPLLISLGGASVLLVLYIAHRMDLYDRETFPMHLKGWIFGYWGWLAKEVFKANIDVAKIVLAPSLPISPRVVRVKATQKTDLGMVIFANSITLTPGTVAVDIEGDEIIVHALSQELADGVLNGDMDGRVTALEER
ncbi:MAG: Na+/H+ antiporter subunit E [Proteobacteria bacterium]|nr:Na+/H+ antiporter subunit E [Pseudomonadota bacterium]